MNLPNKLTVSRFFLTALFLMALLIAFPLHETAALAFFIGASVTDYYDGMLARRHGLITNFGILMDPLAFIAFVELERMAAWMAIVIVARELAITGLRLLAASKQLVLAAERYGKHKTVSQIVCIIAILTSMAYPTWGGWAEALFEFPSGAPWVGLVAEASKWVAVGLTLVSGSVYLWRNREVYLGDM
jgi:CDP-diacylglycerol--glycerol-3-phosphate 3-phosphatidyltransferase